MAQLDPIQMAQMAQMEAAYAAHLQAAAAGIPVAAGPYSAAMPAIAGGPVKGTKPAKADTDWGIPGFDEALTESVMPIQAAVMEFSPEQMASVDDIKNKIGSKILKAAKKFVTDERVGEPGSALQARALIEEFVDHSAGAVSQAFFDKPWLEKVNLAAPLLAAALHTFNGSKIFTRTVAPMLPKYVEEGLFKYAEEERITKAMWEAVVASGVKDDMQKKASQHLAKAYDHSHLKAPYGSTSAETAEIGMLQDFVRGWMLEFGSIGQDVLKYGVTSADGGKYPSRGDQILFLTILFQNLTDARNAALPHELTSLIETPPPSPWAFIAESAESVFDEMEKKEKEKKLEMDIWKAGQAGAAAPPAFDPNAMLALMGAAAGGKGGKDGAPAMDPMMMMGFQHMMGMMADGGMAGVAGGTDAGMMAGMQAGMALAAGMTGGKDGGGGKGAGDWSKSGGAGDWSKGGGAGDWSKGGDGAVASRPGFQASRMCNFFLEGKCQKAENCTFAHTEDEMKGGGKGGGGKGW